MNSRFRPPRFVLAPALAACACSTALPAFAATHSVPADFATITEAIEASEWGDTILVGPGVYQESLILTEQKGDGLILKSTNGPAETSISYGEVINANEAVITLQRCSNSTQVIGFTIDGRKLAKRGILANSGTQAVLVDLVIDGCEYGLASHRNSNPYVQGTTIQHSLTAGLFVQGGSADVRDCSFTAGDRFGVYIRGTGDPVRLRKCNVTGNGQVGVQATDGEFSMEGGVVSGNGDSGIILQDVSPLLTDLTIEGHANVGIVMDASSATIRSCTVRGNEFGAVISIEGTPEILKCSFEDNRAYHLGVEGDANPLIGGSTENANRFVGEPEYAVQSSSTATVIATHNYWNMPCVPSKLFKVSNGRLKRKPWMTPDLTQEMSDCDEARKYFKKWKKGKVGQAAGEAAGSEPSASTVSAAGGGAEG
jgi:hypothetical protein